MKAKVVIADNDELFVRSLKATIDGFKKFEVTTIASNEKDLLETLLAEKSQPDILLLGANMADGIMIVKKFRKDFPFVKTAVLCTKDDDSQTIRMIKAGCCAFIYKHFSGKTFENALMCLKRTGYYNPDIKYILLSLIYSPPSLSDLEIKILKLLCINLTVEEIASEISMPESRVMGMTYSICNTLNVKSQPGMVLEAIRLKFIDLED